MAIIRISRASIETARAAYKRRIEDSDDSRASLEDVVVARDVTLEDFCEVPSDWLDGIRLALLPDGTLIVDRLTLSGHIDNTGLSVRRHGCSVRLLAGTIDFKAFGLRSTDSFRFEIQHGAAIPVVPLVVFEVVVDGASVARSLRMAAGYLRHSDTVHTVVVLKLFPPVLKDGCWNVQALALVFGFEDASDRSSQIQILEAKSFGNVGVNAAAVDVLVAGLTVPDVAPLDRERGRWLLQPGFQCQLRNAALIQDLDFARRNWPLTLQVPRSDLSVRLLPVLATTVEEMLEDRRREGCTEG